MLGVAMVVKVSPKMLTFMVALADVTGSVGLESLLAILVLFITSGSAQWALMVPVVAPMMMFVNVSPEVTQKLHRISLTLPYSLCMPVGWFLFFLLWYYLGIPLGPGAPMGYEV